MTATKAEIGKGIYLTEDISLLLGLPKSKVNKWLADYWSGYYWKNQRTKVVDFMGLIEFYIFYQLREREISAKKIKDAHESLKKLFDTEFPFASSNLITYGKEIKFNHKKTIVDADKTFQLNIPEIVIPFSEKIEYSTDSLAKLFYPAGKNVDIVSNPHIKYGSPVIKGTGIQISVIYNFLLGGEKPDFVAELYQIQLNQVLSVLNFYTNR